MNWWRAIDANAMLAIKTVVAIIASLVLVAGAILGWRGRAHVLVRTRDVLLAGVGVASACCYVNLFHFHFDDYIHEWDFFHYYVGAKYLPELGYTHLYECTVVAESELEGELATGRTIRNLETNDLEPVTAIVADPARCTTRFSAERWRDFSEDVDYFRSSFRPHTWMYEVLHDHGFNGTPVWALLGRPLASVAPASHGTLEWLSLIDPLLLVVMWGAIAWTFGWRVACVGMVWLGTSYPTQFYWTGGAFLRMDWLALAVVGICLVRRGKSFAGGFALAYSALLRVFPAFLIVALLLVHVARWVRARRVTIDRGLRRFVLGGITATALLVPAALIVSGGADTADEFVANSRKHLDTPLTNNMGWKTIVSYDRESRVLAAYDPASLDAFGQWKAARREVFDGRRWLYYAVLVAFVALLVWVAMPAPDWAVLALGAGLIPFAAELTCYYYSFLLVFAMLWPRRPLIGVGLCVTAAASCVIPRLAPWDDARYYDISCYVLIFVVAALIFDRCVRFGVVTKNRPA